MKYFFLGLFFVLLLGLRLFRLGYHDLWYDEAFSALVYANWPWDNSNAPLYWVILHYWIKVFPMTEFFLRLPSVLFNYITVIAVYFLSKYLFNRKTALIAAFICGVSPFHLWYAQEARDYALAAMWATLSSWFLLRAIERQKIIFWILFTVTAILGIYSNYFCLFLISGQLFYLILFKKKQFNYITLISLSLIFLLFSLRLPYFINKFFSVSRGFWIPRPDLQSILITFENFLFGYNGFPLLYIIGNLLVLIFIVSWVVSIKCGNTDINKSLYCLILLIVPLSCIFIFSRLFFSIYLDRGLLIFSPYFYIIIAAGLVNFSKYIRGILLACLAVLLSISIFYFFTDQMYPPLKHHLGTYIKRPVKPIISFLEIQVKSNELLAFTNESLNYVSSFYRKTLTQNQYFFFDPALPDPTWQTPRSEGEGYVAMNNIKNIPAQSFWVVFGNWSRDGSLDENSLAIKKNMDNDFAVRMIKEIEGMVIVNYTPKP